MMYVIMRIIGKLYIYIYMYMYIYMYTYTCICMYTYVYPHELPVFNEDEDNCDIRNNEDHR
jgi:hypothetical protein